MNTAVPISVQRKEGFDPHFCARLFMEAMTYKADITLSYQGRVFNAKMLTDLMSMDAAQGSLIQLQALGDDAGPALNALKALIQRG